MKDLIGIDYVLDQLNIMTPYGGEYLHQLKPFTIKEVKALMSKLNDLEMVIGSLKDYSIFYNRIEREFCRLKDIRGSIKRCKNLEVLDEIQLFEIKQFTMGALSIKNHYEAMSLTIEEVSFGHVEPIIDILDPEKHRMATFSIYDAYSQDLRIVREKKRLLEKSIYNACDREKDRLKEERLRLVAEEELMEGIILSEISLKLLSYMDILWEACDAIGVLDFTIAKAKLARGGKCVKPIFQDTTKLQMIKGRHPYVEDLLLRKDTTFTPIDITLISGSNAITGPNMGGKSVTLKTIALNATLAHLGFYVFAEVFVLTAFDFIHLLSNDYESLKGGLSSFGGEIIQLNEYIEAAKITRGLLLIDEFASGTNPQEGRLLVKALINYLNKNDTISLFVTHFDGVVDASIKHYQVVGLKNVDFDQLMKAVSYDPQYRLRTLQGLMDYRLEVIEQEVEVPKDALRISTLLGFDREITEIAKLYYGQEV